MKKILIFSLAYYPRVGGAEVAIKEITDRISDIEFEMVTLQFGGAPKQEQMGRVLVHRVGFGPAYLSKILFIPLAAVRAWQLHRVRPFGGAWAMMSYMLFPIILLRVLGVTVPYALTLQEGDTYEHMFSRVRIAPFLPILNYGFRHATVIQSISTYLGGWAQVRGFKGKVEVIPNGVDTARFVGAPLQHGGTVLITTSRLVNKNGIDTVIKALPLLPNIHFRVLGTGPEEAELKALAHRLGVEERVEFVGHVEHTELINALHSADIFIRPSRSEGMGNSFIEAFATGLPVIATQEGGIADFLFDAKRNQEKEPTGWAVDKDSPEQIAQAVETILADKGKTVTTVANAKKLALEKYDWNLIAKDMREKVFTKVLV